MNFQGQEKTEFSNLKVISVCKNLLFSKIVFKLELPMLITKMNTNEVYYTI